ncbi:MAG: phenylalanine--tRNA ligase subunit beta [Candidatus Saccharimonadales bacterium]
MKVSLNWIREFMPLELPPIDKLVTTIGAQLGGVDEVVDLAARYRSVVIVRVASVRKHEDSDHLNICLIDDGRTTEHVEREFSGLVQVVCGAPNVREGMFVAWLPPGSVVPSSHDESEPFVLSARPLRGVISNGMLASGKELGIGDSHEGLLELDGEHRPGDSFATAYGLNDTIIDIENKMFTHRPDCFGQLGVAREVAGILGRPFRSPDWYTHTNSMVTISGDDSMRISLTNEIPEVVSRYMLVAIDGITIAPSPVWLQTYLSRLGIRPINNVVDVTNYMMLLTGQPLHAFDFDKVAVDGEATIVVRNPRPKETLTLLTGKTIAPRADAIVICDADQPIGMGGMMGGQNSEIDENTKRILIECASFDMYNIRRSSMEHGIFSDAVTRFTKGQSEWQCPPVLYKAVQLIQELCPDARPVGRIMDNHQPNREYQPVPVSTAFINDRLGSKLSTDDIERLLDNVEFETKQSDKGLLVKPPFWRTDIELREDIVEEVGRLHGYDNLPQLLPRRDTMPAARDDLLELKSRLRSVMAAAGANELLTYSFVHGSTLTKANQDSSQAFQVSNALSPDLQYYRLSLMPSLLEKVHPNLKAGYDQFVLYEIGKGHNIKHLDDQGLPVEFEMLEAVYAAQDKVAPAGAAYFQAKLQLCQLLNQLGVTPDFRPMPTDVDFATVQYFDPARSALVFQSGTDNLLGGIGEFKHSVRRNFKLPSASAGFNLSLTDLMKSVADPSSGRYQPLSRFPIVQQDITLKVHADQPFQQVLSALQAAVDERRPTETTMNLEPVDVYRAADSDYKHISLRLDISNKLRTMTASEVNTLLDEASAVIDAERV